MNFYKKYFGDKYGDFFAQEFKQMYREMMKTLVVDRNLIGNYELNVDETFLLISLLNDIKNDNGTQNSRRVFSRKIRRKLIDVFLAQ